MISLNKITRTELVNKVCKLIDKVLMKKDNRDYEADEYKKDKADLSPQNIVEAYLQYYINNSDLIRDDLKDVDFDWENFSCEPNGSLDAWGGIHTMHNGLTFIACWAGGDWECPVCFILYWDGKDLRGYIPDEGNLWNRGKQRAYGNFEDLDRIDYELYIRKTYGLIDNASLPKMSFEDYNWYDSKFMMIDIMNNIYYDGKTQEMSKAQKKDDFKWEYER